MMHHQWPAMSCVFMLVVQSAFAQAPLADGTIVERTACPPYIVPTYNEYVATVDKFQAGEVEAAKQEGLIARIPTGVATRAAFDGEQAASARVTCTHIVYLSDGLRVSGFMWRPKDTDAKSLPLIIVNRGGNREFGRLEAWSSQHRLAAEGFVVLASQYRGVDGGEGVEEMGGADIHDVQNLVPVARALGNVDTNNVFMFGHSRGGMMTLIALKRGMKVNAAAVIAPPLDWFAEFTRRPFSEQMFSELVPGFAGRRNEVLRDRSAMSWPEQINTPLLIMQGTFDWRSSPADTLAFAQKLQEAGKTYQLIVYANDDHRLNANKLESNRQIVEWFRKHMR
jgi:dipeptidyl aminopeptidase/acylaminoacyl peptidase